MYGHGKLDLKFVHGNAKIGVKATRLDQIVYTSKAETAEEDNKPRVLEKKFVRLRAHKQLLLQINIYCAEVTQNNEMTSLMVQSMLDVCSI